MQINQTFDWLRYIQNNSDTVQRDVKLLGRSWTQMGRPRSISK